MLQMRQFLQEECPVPLKEQIIHMMQREWPQAFEGISGEIPFPENPQTHPTSFVLLDDSTVISHVAVPWKHIQHNRQTFKAYGLSEVMTHPDYRHQGFGLQLVKAATSFIQSSQADLGLFTCQPFLVNFYTQAGWEHLKDTNLIGGTRARPFRSDSLGLSTLAGFFSDKAQQQRAAFEGADIYLELGEKLLW